MGKISINLLPQEFTAEEAKLGTFYKVQAVGFFIILLMIFLSIVTISLRIFQSNRIQNIQLEAAEAESKITSLSSREAQLVLLKNRLSAISQYLGVPSKQASMYTLLDSLLPPALSISSIAVGRNGEVLISALAPDSNTLDRIFTDLLDKEKTEGKIGKVSIETINRGRDGIYRVNFLVEAKK